MTSTVTATLRPGVNWSQVLQTLFPSGSVTGAPKIRTMELIRTLEPDPRGIYCGSVGVVQPNGDAVFNVAIRTVTVDRQRGRAIYGSGGGITWDSDTDGEYQEMRAKTAFLQGAARDFSLIETMAWVDGRWVLERYHWERLHHAVEYFGWPWRSEAVQKAMEEAVCGRQGRWRVRLEYDASGRVSWHADPLPPNPRGVQLVGWATEPMPEADAWTYHKTTWRHRYQERQPASHAAASCFDYLLYNLRGEVTEFTRGNVVVRIGERLVTPPLSAGLLPGTFRQWLLDEAVVREATVTVEEVADAREIWFVNSVRGWVPVRLDAPLPVVVERRSATTGAMPSAPGRTATSADGDVHGGLAKEEVNR
jgi:para-aminobenzoate synthetase/4-amino-4-deoxychorismate lyase